MPFSTHGTFVAPAIRLETSSSVFPASAGQATIYFAESHAGARIGMAHASYERRYAVDASPSLGDTAYITVGSDVIFRGTIVEWGNEVEEQKDAVSLYLADDKHGLQEMIVGQYGVGTVDGEEEGDGAYGFADVAFDIVFNRDGRPNKKADGLDFDEGSSGAYWTLASIMEFLFTYYASASVAELSVTLDGGYTRVPANLNLTGQSALQAIDQVAQLAGESWTLIPGVSVSSFRRVRSAAGTVRTLPVFSPKRGHRASEATAWTPTRVACRKSVIDSRDHHQVASAPIVIERTYTNLGDDPLLVSVSGFKDKAYAYRLRVDVTAYEANGLGKSRSAGARPKPWTKELVTRMKADGSAYLTKAEIDADKTLLGNQRVKPMVWVAADGVLTNAQLVTKGYRIDTDNGTIDFTSQIEVLANDSARSEALFLGAFTSGVGVWLTIATVLEIPQVVESVEGDTYLTRPATQMHALPDLVPERRITSVLPKLDGTSNEKVLISDDVEESYIDVTDDLDDALAGAMAARPNADVSVEARLEFLPICNVGDRIAVSGRDIGATGDEVITTVRYQCHKSNVVSIGANEVVVDVDDRRFMGGRA